MYINFKLIKELNLPLNSVLVLFSANQNRINDESATLEEFKEVVRDLFDLELLENIKRKNRSQNLYSLIRISAKGKKILEDITTPEVSLGDCEMFEYLKNIYLAHEDKDRVVGNAKKVKMYCAILRNHLQMTLHEFYYFLDYFLSVYPYTKKLENLFMDSNKVRYGTFINNIDESPLYQFWQKEEEQIRNYLKLKIK